MHYKWILTSMLMAAMLASCMDTTQIPEKGVSRELAEDRKAVLSDITYRLHFDIPSSPSDPIEGKAVISFDLARKVSQLALDFDVPSGHLKQVRSGDTPLPHEFMNEHILVNGDSLKQGTNTIEVVFTAGDMSLNRNEDYLYSLFVPDRASTAFPCFDQPDLKASWKLDLKIPRGWEAISNGTVTSRQDTGKHTLLSFSKTKPLSTYLFAFAAGDFKKITRTRGGTTIHMYHKEPDTSKVRKNTDKLFDLHFNALQWLEDYTGIPYPFNKFSFVLIPSFQYSGMEHPGATYYRDSRVLLDETATIRDKLNRANLISHETAHMWFGDLVTMKWFDEVWLKEVFANFMADKITRPQYPDVNHRLNFLMNHYPAAYSVDRTRGANPINQRLDNLKDAGTLYGDIIYHKAPIVMRNLEEITGEDQLRKGLRQYLGKNAYGNAGWSDLIRILQQQEPSTDQEDAALLEGDKLTRWSNIWVNQPGMPTITFKEQKEEDNGGMVLAQKDPSGRDRIWKQHLNTEVGVDDHVHREKVFFNRERLIVEVPELTKNPEYALANAEARGYGFFSLEPQTRNYLLNHVSSFDEALQRATIWITLWENLLHHNITPVNFHKAIIKHLPQESNPQCINLVCDYLQTNYWRFLTDRQRESHGRETESVIWSLMEQTERQDVRSTFFKTYRGIASSRGATQKLYSIWEKEKDVEGLSFSENDYITMAYELMLKHPGEQDTIKNRQLERIGGDEKKQEFRFVARALSEDQQARDSFFRSLLDEKNREKEPWVSKALHYLHHPLRAKQSVSYITPALEELREIQATGDIFFPKAWLDATLWGHSSKEAARAVRQFLEAHPDYPEKLENKILQSADLLFRTSKNG